MMAAGNTAFDCVVDASVGIKLFLIEPLSEQADSLFGHLTDDPPSRLYVPDLFFVECANILWKYVRRHGFPEDAARQAVADLRRLSLRSVSTRMLCEAALALSVAHESTAYDSAYVALAAQLSLPLVTADEAMVRRFEHTGLDVRFLGVWPG
ncbi:MAG: PIN domain-containing protein [Anaerolineales bacterium]|nr:MAG: PIN domain-containing protein [Anaerolineales bacterium]